MTVHTLIAPVSSLDLPGGMVLRFEAIDPTTGDAITGVTVDRVAIYGTPLAGSGAVEPFDLDSELPAWVPDGDVEVL